MTEKSPPGPPTVPPQDDDQKQVTNPASAETDASTWGADGKSPAEALSTVPDSLRREGKEVADKLRSTVPAVKTFVGNVRDAIKTERASNYKPLVLEGEPPVAVSADEAPVAPRKVGDYQPHVLAGDAPQVVAPEAAAPAPVDDAEVAKAVVENADNETLKRALAEKMLKPAEIKRLYRESLRDTVARIGLEEYTIDIDRQGPLNYGEFKRSLEREAGIAAREQYAALKQADDKYEDAYKRFYYNNNVVERVFKRLRPLGAASLEIHHARQERDQKRIETRDAFVKEARERWEAQGKKPEWIERALNKYENYWLFKDIVNPGANRDVQMRAEALGEKVPDMLEKGLGWLKRGNERIDKFFVERVGEKHAKVVRMIGTALLVSGGAATLGAFGTAGLVGAAGIGGLSLMRAFGSSVVGLVAAEAVGNAYLKFRGKKEQAKAVVSEAELREELKRLARNGELTAEILDTIERRRLQLIERSSDQTLMQKVTGLKVLVGLGVGVGTAATLMEWQSTSDVMRATEQGVPDSINTPIGSGAEAPAPAGTPGGVSAEAPAPSAESTPAPSAPAAPESAADAPVPSSEAPAPTTDAQSPASPEAVPTAPEASPEAHSLSISGSINNADRLVGHFGVELQEAFPNPETAPPSVQRFFELFATEQGASLLSGEDNATLALGLQLEDGRSAIMQPGDTITLSADNEIVLERPGADGFRSVLVNANGEVAAVHNFPMEGTPSVPEVAPTTEVPAAEVPQQPEPVPAEPPVTATPEPTPVEPAPAPVEVPRQPEVPPAPQVASSVEVPQEPSVAETSEPTPAAPAEQPAPAPEQPAPASPEVTVNKYGLEIDPRVAGVYADAEDNLIIHGGTLEERMELARTFILNDHNAVIYFDSSTPDPLTGLTVAHVTQAFWDANSNSLQMPNEVMNPALQGATLPLVDDLARRVEMP